jgi:hypothetical protein
MYLQQFSSYRWMKKPSTVTSASTLNSERSYLNSDMTVPEIHLFFILNKEISHDLLEPEKSAGISSRIISYKYKIVFIFYLFVRLEWKRVNCY